MAEKLGNFPKTQHVQSNLSTNCPMMHGKLKHPSFSEELIYKGLLAIAQIFSYLAQYVLKEKV